MCVTGGGVFALPLPHTSTATTLPSVSTSRQEHWGERAFWPVLLDSEGQEGLKVSCLFWGFSLTAVALAALGPLCPFVVPTPVRAYIRCWGTGPGSSHLCIPCHPSAAGLPPAFAPSTGKASACLLRCCAGCSHSQGFACVAARIEDVPTSSHRH